MMSIKKKRNSKNNFAYDSTKEATLRQQIKELIDIIGYRED